MGQELKNCLGYILVIHNDVIKWDHGGRKKGHKTLKVYRVIEGGKHGPRITGNQESNQESAVLETKVKKCQGRKIFDLIECLST